MQLVFIAYIKNIFFLGPETQDIISPVNNPVDAGTSESGDVNVVNVNELFNGVLLF